MYKQSNKRRTKLALDRETLRRLSDQELRDVHGGITTYPETVTDEMGNCCPMSIVVPCC